MHPRAAELISHLDLRPHPEGGYYREVFRSEDLIQPSDERDARAALTTIYFLLTEGTYSCWHQLRSDEVWHFYEGDPLRLHFLDADFGNARTFRLGSACEGQQPVAVVPAQCWQAARSTGSYTLVGCSMGPGFDFADFRMLRDLPEETASLRQRHPGLADFL